MAFYFDVISGLFSMDSTSLLLGLGSLLALPILGMTHSGELEADCDCSDEDCNCEEGCGCGCGHEELDPQQLQQRVAELEQNNTRTLEESEELAGCYVNLASIDYEEGEDLDVVIGSFDKAIQVLQSTLTQGEDADIRRNLGNVFLHRAVTYNDYDELNQAVASYDEAIKTLKPLEDAGDGEAKYDIAGIRLNRGTIYHEQGEYEKAKTDFEESFAAFRAVEKISDLDTRYFMAKVSVGQGSLFRDMGEPLDKVVDAYNRAMRLFVELIDIGQMEHEWELANTLLDRCMATFEEYKEMEFESDADRVNKYEDVLIDVGRGIEILERVVDEGNEAARVDLFNALVTEGAMLMDIEKYEEAIKVYGRAIDEFSDFADETDPVLLNQYAAAYENRGFCSMNLGFSEAALDDFNESIILCEKIQSPDFELDEEERIIFVPTLATYYANRANAHSLLGNKEGAQKDCQYGLEMIRGLRQQFGPELEEIEKVFENLAEQMS